MLLGTAFGIALIGIVAAGLLLLPGKEKSNVPMLTAVHVAQTEIEKLSSDVEKRTLQMFADLDAWKKGAADKKIILKDVLVRRAAERLEALSTLARKDANRAATFFVPASDRTTFPADAAASLEELTTIEGVVTVVHADYFDQNFSTDDVTITDDKGVVRHLISQSKEGEDASLAFSGMTSDMRVRIAASWEIGDTLVIPSKDAITILEGGKQHDEVIAPALASDGPQRTLFILANFLDDTTTPYPRSFAENALFDSESPAGDNPNSVNALFQEFTANLRPAPTTYYGDTINWLTMDLTKASLVDYCGPAGNNIYLTTIRDKAIAKFLELNPTGYTIRDYGRIVIANPRTSCGFSGLSTQWQGVFPVPGQADAYASVAIINSTNTGLTGTIGHELGHGTFAFAHARALECGTQIVCSPGTVYEYGEVTSIMGPSPLRHLNTVHKLYGFDATLTGSQKVFENGTYTIKPILYSGGGTTMLQIPKRISGTPAQVYEWYYVTYRKTTREDGTPYYFDTVAPTVPSGVYVHWNEQYSITDRTNLLDMSPAVGSDFSNSVMQVGQSLTDPVSNVRFTLDSLTATQATVTVTGVVETTCIRRNPTVTVSPGSQTGGRGSVFTYTVTVTNNNNAICGPVNAFGFSQSSYPTGWTAVHTPSNIQSVVSGETRTVTLTLTSPADAVPANYPFVTRAHNYEYPQYVGSSAYTGALILDSKGGKGGGVPELIDPFQ